MKTRILLGVTALAIAAPAFAQDADGGWTGAYVGGRVGYAWQPNRNNETVLFDRDLNGSFGDTVTTAAGANAFSPGFCGGGATSSGPGTGCTKDKDGIEFAVHAGYDYQFEGGFVVGILGEYGTSRGRDSVSAFSTTPASYTLTRRLRDTYGVRGRIGYASGDMLFYGTGGATWGKVKNSFATTNTANAFTTTGNDTATGYRFGGGIERKLGANLSVGILYLHTALKDDDYRVRAGNSGTTPATNPFLLGSPSGTDFARSADKIKTDSVALTASFRF